MRKISKLLARLMIVCVSGAVFITGCGELSGMETAAGTEAAASEMTAETVSESQEEEKAVQEEKPRLVENDEEEETPDRALVKANQVQNTGDEVIYPVSKSKANEKERLFRLCLYGRV